MVGKILAVPVERVVRIRTGREDQAAVTPAVVAGQASDRNDGVSGLRWLDRAVWSG